MRKTAKNATYSKNATYDNKNISNTKKKHHFEQISLLLDFYLFCNWNVSMWIRQDTQTFYSEGILKIFFLEVWRVLSHPSFPKVLPSKQQQKNMKDTICAKGEGIS